jgi:isoamylase
MRRDHPVPRRRRFFGGDAPDGNRMQDSGWHWDEARAVAVFLNRQAITEPDQEGDRR